MVTKEQIRDWLDVDARNKHFKEIEKVIDAAIKRNAISGKTTFYISTGHVNNHAHRHEKSGFYDIWHCKGLSDDSTRIVQNKILEEYTNAGFNIEVVNIDCGWNSRYDGVQFTDIHKMLSKEKTNE